MPGETKQHRRANWGEFVTSLNAVGGFQNDATGWQLLWRNWRYRVRRYVRNNITNIGGTHGGSGIVTNDPTEPGEGTSRVVDIAANLQGLDSRVMALLGWDTVTGIPGCVEVSVSGAVTQRLTTVDVSGIFIVIVLLQHNTRLLPFPVPTAAGCCVR